MADLILEVVEALKDLLEKGYDTSIKTDLEIYLTNKQMIFML